MYDHPCKIIYIVLLFKFEVWDFYSLNTEKDEKNTDVELFKKIEQSINSYDINVKRKIEEEKLLRESADKGEATESSSSVIDEKASADVQADSIQVSEKTESDSSTSVETEKSED
jgi:hypothetical protein